MTGREVAADHHKLVIYGPVSDGNARQCGHRYGACHTWYHSHRDSGVGARHYLFIATSEDERVAAFEAHHKAPGSGPFDHHLVDRVLRHRPAVRDLGSVDDFHVWRQLGEQFGRRKPVGDHDVGLGQQTPAADGDELRVARPPADQGYPTAHDVGAFRT